MKIVAIVGSRDFPRTSYNLIAEYVAQLPPDTMVISGGARGVDKYSVEMAEARGLRTKVDKVTDEDWQRYGKRAGFMRNSRLVAAADEVVAFWDGASNGTRDTMKKTREAKKPLTVIRADGLGSVEGPLRVYDHLDVHSCHNECPCHVGGEPAKDFEGG